MLDLKKATESSFTNSADEAVGVFQPIWFGRIGYQAAYKKQLDFHQRVCQNTKSIFLMGCEHDPVITAGRRIGSSQSPEQPPRNAIQTQSMMRQGIPVVQSSRGGLMTLHSPGQLVIYPILDLREHQLSVRSYVCLLLKCTEQFLNELGVPAYLKLDQPGVFTDQGKIAFCGVQVRDHVTLHGVSINISNDLNLFSLIESCGVQNQKLDRVQKFNETSSKSQIFESSLGLDLSALHKHWARIFEFLISSKVNLASL